MRILKTIYRRILLECPDAPPETGIILGGRNGIIVSFAIDTAAKSEYGCYQPDLAFTSNVLAQWDRHKIQFYGFAHSHISEKSLSAGDRSYITEILLALPDYVNALYFPIIIPHKCIIAYRAQQKFGELDIYEDDIILVGQ